MPSGERTSNARLTAYIAGATLVLTAAVVLVGPALAGRLAVRSQTGSPGGVAATVIGDFGPRPPIPGLPAAGEQPADAGAATEAVRLALETAFAGGN